MSPITIWDISFLYHFLEDVSTPVSFFLGRHSPGYTIDHYLPILVCTDRPKFGSVFLRIEFQDLHSRGDGISNSHRRKEFHFLGKVDGTMSRKDVSQNIGKEPDGEEAMGDPSLKDGFLCIGLVEMDRVKIPSHSGKIINICFQ